MHSSVFWYLLYLLFFNSSNITKTNEDISGMGEKEIVLEYLAFINFKSDSFISLDVVFNRSKSRESERIDDETHARGKHFLPFCFVQDLLANCLRHLIYYLLYCSTSKDCSQNRGAFFLLKCAN